MNERHDVVVIGAGPAGSVAAFVAARRGLDVLLLERARFPRFKVCGCCLNARAVQALDRIGMADLGHALRARPLRRLVLHAGRRSASFRLQGSVSISRSRLDQALARRAVEAGARFLDGTTATVGPADAAGRSVELQLPDGASRVVRAGVVVVADGLSGTALRHRPELSGRVSADSRVGTSTIVTDVPPGFAPDAVRLACAGEGYVGLVGLEDGRLNIAAALDRDAIRAGPGRSVAAILRQNGLPIVPGLEAREWRGTPALTRRRPIVAGERFFILGDAAGYLEPFTGEGIAWAVEAAVAASDWFCPAARRWDARAAPAWMRRHRSLVRRRRWGCRLVAGILRRPRLTRALIGLCGRTPGLVRPFVRHLTQPSPTAGRGGA